MSDISPLVVAVVDEISGRIHRGEFAAGRGLPSERLLSEEFSVSRVVVRAAIKELHNRGLIDCKPRCRPVVRARSLSRASSASGSSYRTIAIWVWPNAGEYGASMILQGIQRVSTSPDIRLVVASAVGADWNAVLESEERFLRTVASDPHSAGVIVYYLGHERNIPALRALQSAGLPVVLVDRTGPEGFECDFVGTDNEGSAAAMVRHILASGHKRIACFTNSDPVSSVRGREAGYRDALAGAGIPFRKEYVFRDIADNEDFIEQLVLEMMAMEERPTAVFAVNDTIALRVHEVLTRHGFKVPEDVSLAGFDGVLRWVPGGGHITTARQNFERIGQVATELLLQRIENGGAGACRHVLLEAPLMDQRSVSSPATSESLRHSTA